MSLLDLAARAVAADGVAPFNEATALALQAGDTPRVVESDGSGAAVAFGDAPVEIVVDPDHRRQGLGGALLGRMLESGERLFWAHGDLPAAQALAASAGLTAERSLLILRAELSTEPQPPRVSGGIELRTFEPFDADAVVAVNARAFADHPEQGAMDRADFDRRAASSWFDPAGLFVADRDGAVVGFHWTKVEDGVGEVYVVGVDPSEQGTGLGTALTSIGLRHLYERRIRIVELYVEADNAPALAVYHRLGFTEHARDTLYTR